jgi:hypothetical protein
MTGPALGFDIKSFDKCVDPLVLALQQASDYTSSFPFKIELVYSPIVDYSNSSSVDTSATPPPVAVNKEIDAKISSDAVNYSPYKSDLNTDNDDDDERSSNQETLNGDCDEEVVINKDESSNNDDDVRISENSDHIVNDDNIGDDDLKINSNDDHTVNNAGYDDLKINNNDDYAMNGDGVAITDGDDETVNNDDDDGDDDNTHHIVSSDERDNATANETFNINAQQHMMMMPSPIASLLNQSSSANQEIIPNQHQHPLQLPVEINGITYIFEYYASADLQSLRYEAHELSKAFCLSHSDELFDDFIHHYYSSLNESVPIPIPVPIATKVVVVDDDHVSNGRDEDVGNDDDGDDSYDDLSTRHHIDTLMTVEEKHQFLSQECIQPLATELLTLMSPAHDHDGARVDADIAVCSSDLLPHSRKDHHESSGLNYIDGDI